VRIGELARRAGLARATLLYYDRIGLLRPSGRTEAGYRIYTAEDAAQLDQIRMYRDTGLPLAAIRGLLRAPASEQAALLERQVRSLAERIEELRARQQLVVKLLRKPRLLESTSPMNRKTWSALLRAAGFDDDAMWRWHADFERTAPDDHQRFLEFLSVPATEVTRIRRRSRRLAQAAAPRRTTASRAGSRRPAGSPAAPRTRSARTPRRGPSRGRSRRP
jgi:DNA-binding transcriptional MerR regulator